MVHGSHDGCGNWCYHSASFRLHSVSSACLGWYPFEHVSSPLSASSAHARSDAGYCLCTHEICVLVLLFGHWQFGGGFIRCVAFWWSYLSFPILCSPWVEESLPVLHHWGKRCRPPRGWEHNDSTRAKIHFFQKMPSNWLSVVSHDGINQHSFSRERFIRFSPYSPIIMIISSHRWSMMNDKWGRCSKFSCWFNFYWGRILIDRGEHLGSKTRPGICCW